jgi:lysophospholipase L1-like esterase
MTNSAKRVRAGAVVVGLAIALAGSFAVPASAGGAGAAGGKGGRYLALGDSVAFGFSPELEDPWVPERFVGYAEIVGEHLGVRTTNLACPGQTARALLSRTAPDAGCFESRAATRAEGVPFLKVNYRGTQISAAVGVAQSARPPSLVSIQGGGNDWFLCVDGGGPNCLDRTLPKVTRSLRLAVTQLRDAGYRGPIVLVGYHLVTGFEADLQRVNRAVERAADATHVGYADTATSFRRYADKRTGDLCTSGLLAPLPDGTCDLLHPSPTGYRLMADAVLHAAARTEQHAGCKEHDAA